MNADGFREKNVQYYDQFARRFRNKHFLSLDPAAQYEFDRVLGCLDLTKQKSIIDLGCGVGRYSLGLARMGYRVTAVDISAKSLALVLSQAKKYNITAIRTLRHDFSTPKEKNAYDTGICISTYHAISDSEEERIRVLANFVQSIKSGGKLLLVEPNPANPLFYLFYLLYPGVQRENIRSFLGSSPFRLREILRSLGMKDIRVRYVGFLPLRWIKKVPAVRLINEILNRIPIINNFSAFSYITARR